MNVRRLGVCIAVFGLIADAVAIYWWSDFYRGIAHHLGRTLQDMGSCLYSKSGLCGIAIHATQMLGKTAYPPILFWCGTAGLVIGIGLRFSATPAPRASHTHIVLNMSEHGAFFVPAKPASLIVLAALAAILVAVVVFFVNN